MSKKPDLCELVEDVVSAIENWLNLHLSPKHVLDSRIVIVHDGASDGFAIAAAKGYCQATIEYWDHGRLVEDMLAAYAGIHGAVREYESGQGDACSFMEFLAEFLARTQLLYHSGGKLIEDYGQYYNEIDQLRNGGALSFWGYDSQEELVKAQGLPPNTNNVFNGKILKCKTAFDYLDMWR